MYYHILGYVEKRLFPQNTSCIYNSEVPEIMDNVKVCNESCQKRERRILLGFYEATNGNQWTKSTGWNTNMSHCEWFGVLCDYKTKHVIALSLTHNNLNGKWKAKLTDFHLLLGLCFARNNIKGNLQKLIEDMPKTLLRFSFAYNYIEGNLPMKLHMKLPLLEKLQLTGTEVKGSLPNDIGNLSHLRVLSVGETHISGSVPASITNLKKLWFLDLEALNLQGNIASFLNLTKIRYLHLSSNNIKGEIPEDIGYRWPIIHELLLQSNDIHGPIPRSIGLLNRLETFNVARNKMRGKIPVELGHLHLKVLVLSNNNFEGFENGLFFNSTRLSIFMAANLKACISNLDTIISMLMPSKQSLMQLDLSHSNINGTVPDTIFDFKPLTFVRLASNRLTGHIPAPSDNVPYLTLLDLSNNDFSGHIPASYSRLLMLLELHLRGNKRMKGSVVSTFLKLDRSVRVKERKSDTCPLVVFSHNHGSVFVDSSYYDRKHCHCDEHYYGSGGFCYPCLEGAKCPGIALDAPSNISSIAKMYIKTGYWPLPREKNVSGFHQCPTSLFQNNICIPNGKCDCYLRDKTNGSIEEVFTTSEKYSKGSLQCNKQCLCAEGHWGRFCSQCKIDYYQEGIRCIRCPYGADKSNLYGLLFGSTIAVVAISLAIIYISKGRKKLAIALATVELVIIIVLVLKKFVSPVLIQLSIIIYVIAFSSDLKSCRGLFKGAVFYIQVMDTLVSTTPIWPKLVYNAQTYVSSSLNLHFSSLACPFPMLFTLFAKNLSLFLLPIICSTLIWLVYYIWRHIKMPDEEPSRKFNYKCRQFCIIFIDLAYFPIVQSTLAVISGCRNINDISFLKNYVWIDCDSNGHMALKIIAILAVIIYVIGVPFFLYCPLLYRYRDDLSDDAPCSKWLGQLITPYKPKFRPYMEVILLLRRLSMAILMTSFPLNEASQTLSITILLIIAIVLQTLAKPFKSPLSQGDYPADARELGLENIMEILMMSVMLLSFVSCGLSIGHRDFSFTSALFILTVIANGVYIISFCFCVLYRLVPKSYRCTKEVEEDDKQRPLLSVIEDDFQSNLINERQTESE